MWLIDQNGNELNLRGENLSMRHNMKIEGVFLPALAGLIPFLTGTVLPALAVGALSGQVSTGVQELYLKKGGRVCQIDTDGEGLYLGPASGKGFETVGNGLYLMNRVGCMTVED